MRSEYIGKLQFYWRMKKNLKEKNLVPDFVDFSFTLDKENNLIKQKIDKKTILYLETIYKENYNVGYLQEGHALSNLYGDDFLKFIISSIKNHFPETKKIFEIGAGGCFMLNKLKAYGFNVNAIDPSPIALNAGNKYKINVIQEFYPCLDNFISSDLIFHYDVLEHIEDPVSFLNFNYNDLNNNGLVIIAVPDCSEYIKKGDISMILHEHLNYFDEDSLKMVINKSKLSLVQIKRSNYGRVLFGLAKKDKDKQKTKKIESSENKFELFIKNYKSLKNQILGHIIKSSKNGKTLGFYIPLRALPYLSLLREINKVNIRFFDDNEGIYNNYFDGFNFKIENFSDLVDNPPDILYVFSEAFGITIKEKVQISSSKIEILTLEDFIR